MGLCPKSLKIFALKMQKMESEKFKTCGIFYVDF